MGLFPFISALRAGVGSLEESNAKKRSLEEALADKKRKIESARLEDALRVSQTAENNAHAESLLHPTPSATEYETLDTPDGFVRVPKSGPAGPITGPSGQPYKKRVEPRPSEPLEVVLDKSGHRIYAERRSAVGQSAPEPAPREPVAPKPNEANTKAAGMLHRVIPAGQSINTFDDRKTLDAIASKAGIFGNWASSPEGRRLKVAGDAWVYGVLRPESGATIGDKERETYNQTYLPQPGDDDATLSTKRENRRTAEEGVAIQAGPALPAGSPRSAMEADSTANPSAFNAKYHEAPASKVPNVRKPTAAEILAKHGIR